MRRPILLGSGVGLLAATWSTLPAAAEHSFSAHMVMHMLVVAVGSPLLSLGIAGTRADPVRAIPAVFSPMSATVVEMIVVWGWHVPAFHALARRDVAALGVEQTMFLGAGMYLWLACAGGDAEQRPTRTMPGVVGLLLTSMHMTLLGALLGLAPRVLYLHAGGTGPLDPLRDQQLGGAIMLAVGGAAYLAGGLWLMASMLRDVAGSVESP